MNTYRVIIFAGCIFSVYCQTEFPRNCPTITTKTNLDKEKYLGQWYEIKRFPNTLIPGECGSADYYEQTPHGYNITYKSRDIPNNNNSEIRILIEKEVLKSPFAKYEVYYDCARDKIPHYILETDYETYSIVWGCGTVTEGILNTQRLYIYSREKTLDKGTIDKALELLGTLGIDHTKLVDVEQDDTKCGRNEPAPSLMFNTIN